jgi:hypothetical protein
MPLASDAYIHAYLFTNARQQEQCIEVAMNRLMSTAEKLVGRVRVPVTLITELKTDAGAVQDILSERFESVAARLKKATDFHFTVWMTMEKDPAHKQLLALH